MSRVLIVRGDTASINRALTVLDNLLQRAGSEGLEGIYIEALALQSLAYWKMDDTTTALIALENALRHAQPEGYLRLFADLGLPMARLFQEARSRDVMPVYVEQLIEASGSERSAADLTEPLTAREQEILALLAAGLTNREIAEQLVIAAGTVKKHVSNLMGKLNVSNRTEAAATARELKLLD